jgi:UDP-glucuronate decarboxylase
MDFRQFKQLLKYADHNAEAISQMPEVNLSKSYIFRDILKCYLVVKNGKFSFKNRLNRAFECLKHGVTSYTFVRYNKEYQLEEPKTTFSEMKRILVTGGAGFIGSHLCDRLVKEGNDVICLDNFYTGSKENVWHLIGKPNFEIVRHDVCQPYWAEIDEIYNLACPASPVYYQNDPIQTTKTSVFGAYFMLGLARRTKCKILQSSTSEVYGDPTVHPQPETYWGNVNMIGVRSCYDEGKRCAETLFYDYHRLHGLRIKIIRIFNTYGPRMAENDGRVISNFIMQALRGEDITIYGDGTQTRSFQYVSDLIEGMIRMMNSGDDFTGPVNIGNPGEFTMLELAEKVIAMTGSKSKIVFSPLPSDDPKMRKPDIALAKAKLNWEPKVGLDEGLKETIDYFKSRL